ncbi:MAG: aminopeptidase P family N-terminal domain-containing protein, partial [Rhizobium sp.]|nr:aminopeptidase P family N-terminal domain-containing protein [Rhizobium sp.]
MFQSFDVTSTPQFGRERVERLRARFEALGIDGFLVTRADEYQGEYVPACAERLSWLTGFTGSAGQALITMAKAVVFVDGRYVTQLAEQVDPAVFSPGDLVGEPPHKWIAEHAHKGFRLGIDPWLHTSQEVERLEKALAEQDGALVVLGSNPLDAIWSDRPAEPLGPVVIQPIEYSGVLAKDKIAWIAADLGEKKIDAALITDPSSIAWIFNLRGSDVPHTPHPLARAIIRADGTAELFLDKRKTGIEAEAYLGQMCHQLDPQLLVAHLEKLSVEGKRILIDPDLAPFAL